MKYGLFRHGMRLPAPVTACVLVGAISLFGPGILLGPDSAWAQTAKDLKCNKCVDARDIDRKAIKRSQVKNGAISFKKLQPQLAERANTTQPFYATLNTNGEQTVVTHGPLSIIFQCSVNEAGNDVIRVFATSTVAGWFTGDGVDDSGEFTGPNAAGETILLDQFTEATGTARVDDIINGDVIVAPGGFLLSYPDDANMRAFNVLGNICTYAGVFYLIKGTP